MSIEKQKTSLTPLAAETAHTRESTVYSCVLDQDPFMAAQCFIWLNCLLEIQAVPPSSIFVHHTGLASADFAGWLESRHINLVQIKPYDARSPHCNKLRQLKTFSQGRFDRIVLMDCDTAWVGQAPLPRQGLVAGKIVDYARPSENILAAIFQEAGLGQPEWVPVSIPTGAGAERSDRNNLNGGLYVLAGTIMPQLDVAWRKWADWCLDHRPLFGEFAIHVDQVGFALALRELGMAAERLPVEWNYPSHLPAACLPDVTPQIIHFHRQMGRHGKIERIGLPKPDAAIDLLNQHIEGFLTQHLVNSVFWDLRYRVDPALGSGVGSRGECLTSKRQWVAYALGTFGQKAVVDVGCGDLEVMRTQAIKNYVGLDVSKEALALAGAKRPDWRFVHVTDESPFVEGDAVVCLDVLIHQKQASQFDALIKRLAAAARQRLIVSGFNQPQATAGICSFHRPLVAALAETGLFSEISVIGQYRETDLVVADKNRPDGTVHPNDIAAADFNEGSRLSKRPDLLRYLADLSREAFGFFSNVFPRTQEYPWVAERLESVRPGQRVLEVGAGLNPLPLFLARRGVRVDTVDSHPLVRVPPTLPTWNEEGFYDYGRVDANLRSHHLSALDFQPEAPFDVVYAVSVMEQMTRTTWEAILTRCRSWLPKNGRLILSVGLIPGTEALWNYAEGREVEPVSVHGNVADLINCLDGLGFSASESVILSQVPKSKTDLFFVDCLVD